MGADIIVNSLYDYQDWDIGQPMSWLLKGMQFLRFNNFMEAHYCRLVIEDYLEKDELRGIDQLNTFCKLYLDFLFILNSDVCMY